MPEWVGFEAPWTTSTRKSGIMKRQIVSAMTAVLLGLLVPVTSFAADEVFRRWAILPTPDAASSGLSDLLTVELSQRSFTLVEREQLAEITKEIELSKLFSPDSSLQRLKVGQLTKADALVLLSVVEHDKRKFVKLVISDCRYGSRLRLDHFPFAADGQEPRPLSPRAEAANDARGEDGSRREPPTLERLVQDLANAIEETRRQFTRGVERIVAVSPFLSKNLTHDFDHLQSGYAVLLETSLADRPGIAVLEIEEARQIQKELNLVGAELAQRRMPLFVEGEFEVSGRSEKSSVRLTVDLVGANSERQRIEKSGLTSDEVVNQLTRIVPVSLLRMVNSSTGDPLSRQQQFERLAARAQVLAEVRSLEHAIGLREAALLLKPDDVGERLTLIQDGLVLSVKIYHEDEARRRAWSRSSAEVRQTTPQPIFRYHEHRQLFEIVGGHLEFLMGRKLLNSPEASRLVTQLAYDGLLIITPVSKPDLPESEETYHRIGWRLLSLLSRLDPSLRQGEFHPRFQGRPDSGQSPELSVYSQRKSGIRAAIDWENLWVNSHLGPQGGKPGDAKLWLAHLERLFTEVFPAEYPFPQPLEMTLIGIPDTLAKLKTSETELRAFYNRLKILPGTVGLYGRAGILQLDGDAAKTAEELRPLQRELLVLRSDFAERLDASDCDEKPVCQSALFAIIDAVDARWRRKQRQVTGQNVAVAKRHLLPRNPIPAPAPRQRVQFRPLDLAAPWIGWQRCTKSMDVAWTHTKVDVIEPGQLPRQILSVDLPDRVVGVTWDGEVFWIPTIQRGIQLISPGGEVVGKLPLALPGSFPNLSDSDATGRQSEAGTTLPPFNAVILHEHDDSWRRNHGAWSAEIQGLFPLWPVQPGRCLAIGLIEHGKRTWIAELQRSATVPSGVTSRIIHTATKTVDPKVSTSDPRDSRLAFEPTFTLELRRDSHRTLMIGRHWSRVDAQQGTIEELTTHPLPVHHRFENYATSAVHGLVAWNYRDRLYQVLIDQPWDDGDKPENHYAFVPEPLRERHAAAVHRIQELGGHVATQWGMSFIMSFTKSPPAWGTLVFLPAGWKGGDEQLRLLEDLYQLNDLRLVQAPITNAGVERIARLASLEQLWLVETKITDEGLIHLPRLPVLRYLHLEGTAGGTEFSDLGLEHVSQIEHLKILLLYGPGFTDDGLPWLQRPKSLWTVWWMNTTISSSGKGKLLAAKPNLHISDLSGFEFPKYAGTVQE
jgi:curli production assembly/transport component CsgG